MGRVDGPERLRSRREQVDVLPLAMDDPKHAHPQARPSAGFTRDGSTSWPRASASSPGEHWNKCLEMGEFDYVTDFAGKLPMDVVSELLDVPSPIAPTCASSPIC